MTKDGSSHGISSANPCAIEDVAAIVHLIGDEYVVFADDLSQLYGRSLRELEEAVERNPGRFPSDFAFRPSPDDLRGRPRGHPDQRRSVRPVRPLAFTLAGIGMLGSIFRSEQVAKINVTLLRAIAKFRDTDRIRARHGVASIH